MPPVPWLRHDNARAGYVVQWPYVQPSSGGEGRIPASLLRQCALRRSNASTADLDGPGWMWDPFEQQVCAVTEQPLCRDRAVTVP